MLSPLFFTLYVNDLENEFTKRGNSPTELQLLSLYLLMHADDMVWNGVTVLCGQLDCDDDTS